MKESVKRVIEMRLTGATYPEIAKATGAAKGTISYICRKYVPNNTHIYQTNQKLIERVPTGQNHLHTAAAREGLRKYIENRRATLLQKWVEKIEKLDPVRVAYIAGLYAGEGVHWNSTMFSLSNSKKEIIIPFVSFLKDIGAEWVATLTLHMSQDSTTCVQFWADVLPNIDYVRQYDSRSQKRDNTYRDYYGTVDIRVRKPAGLRAALQKVSGLYV